MLLPIKRSATHLQNEKIHSNFSSSKGISSRRSDRLARSCSNFRRPSSVSGEDCPHNDRRHLTSSRGTVTASRDNLTSGLYRQTLPGQGGRSETRSKREMTR